MAHRGRLMAGNDFCAVVLMTLTAFVAVGHIQLWMLFAAVSMVGSAELGAVSVA
jgi:hypothetical protein